MGTALVLLLSFATAAPGHAQTEVQKLEALEARVETLERALAISHVDVAALVRRAAPAVVSIYLTDREDRVSSQGTGFLTTADGNILTNAHVVQEAERVKVKFHDGRAVPAEVVLVDPFLDMAIIDVDGTGYPMRRSTSAFRRGRSQRRCRNMCRGGASSGPGWGRRPKRSCARETGSPPLTKCR